MIARLAPRARRTQARALLAIEEGADRVTLAVVRPGDAGSDDEVLAALDVPRSGDPARDLQAACAAFAAAGWGKGALPREAVLVTDAATAACVEAPPTAGLPPERVDGLVRWELEPLLPEPPAGGLACGWAEREAAGREAGPLFVCGVAAARRETIVVPDVHAFPGHIACDSRSNSEIVTPVFDRTGALAAVLDVDSTGFNAFDGIDRAGLEAICGELLTLD